MLMVHKCDFTHNIIGVLIGSTVLTFIGYKQTNKQTPTQRIYIDKQKYDFRKKDFKINPSRQSP